MPRTKTLILEHIAERQPDNYYSHLGIAFIKQNTKTAQWQETWAMSEQVNRNVDYSKETFNC